MRRLDYRTILPIALAGLGLFFLFTCLFAVGSAHEHFAWLAESFWQGRLDLPAERLGSLSGPLDLVRYGGKYYWPLGPLPAVLLMPLVAVLGTGGSQSLGHLLLVLGVIYLAHRLCLAARVSFTEAVWLTFAFCLGSVMIGVLVLDTPWFMSNVVAVFFLLAALVEQRGRRRPEVLGLLVGLALMTRLTAGLAGLIFFAVLELLGPNRDFRWRRLLRLLWPVLFVALLLIAYNQLRFGTPLTSGYSGQWLAPGTRNAAAVAEYGLVHPAFMPRNLTHYFLKLPEWRHGWPVADPEGLSVLLLSPFFAVLLLRLRRSRELWAALAATAVTLPILLSHFGTGGWQFGPRYLTDLWPFWFLLVLLAVAERPLRPGHRALIAASGLLNMFLFAVFAAHHLFT